MLAMYPRVHTVGLSHDEFRTLIAKAGNRIDAALARRYPVPFTTEPTLAPPLIRDLAAEMAAIDAFDRSPETPEWIIHRRKELADTLRAILDGDLAVVGADGGVIPERTDIGTITSTTSQYTPVFGGAKSLDERTDPGRRSDEGAQRGYGSGVYDDWSE
jgi:hypothetical protein